MTKKNLFLALLFSVAFTFWMQCEEGDIPDFLQDALGSRGKISMSVEVPETKAIVEEEDIAKNLDDFPSFSKEGSSDLFENPVIQEKNLEKKPTLLTEEPIIEKKLPSIQKEVPVEKSVSEPTTPEIPSSPMFRRTSFRENETIEAPSEFTEKEIEAIKQQPTIRVTPKHKQNDDQEGELPVLIEQEEQQVQKQEKHDEEVVFNFENADLSNLVSYIEMLFDITFITDDAIKPFVAGAKGIEGNKISFKTNKPMSKKKAWGLFLTFLDMAGLSVTQQADPTVYRISTTERTRKSSIQSFIGIDPELLPDNDIKIRYVYFVKDTPVDTLKSVLNSLKSSSAMVLILQELKAFIIVDSAYNVKSLMRIIKELDKVSMPQSMSVLKLKRVDADHVKKLYDSLVKSDQQQKSGTRLFGPRKSATTLYFPQNAQMIVEPRTNSLILLGTEDEIKRIEEFVVENIDVASSTHYSPLHVHQLKYADAITVAEIMNGVTKFGRTTIAARTGGVRGSDKYLKPMTFTPEPSGNRLVIRGEYEDYLKAKEIIEQLDEPQPQVAVEILILSVGISDIKELGAQFRNSPRSETLQKDGLLGRNINFQTSGIRLGGAPNSVVLNDNESGSKRLLGDLVSLVTGSSAGNTILSLGSDAYGVWGIFHALKTVTNLQVISNPFLMATNKTKATVSLGEIRNVQTATIKGTTDTPTFSDKTAKLQVDVTPQINSDGMIVLKLKVDIVEFRDDSAAAVAAVARTNKVIDTTTIVADKEILALGGLIKNKVENGLNKWPVLGNIPILGWLFKNKKKSETKEDLLILISARIIDPRKEEEVDQFTASHIGDYKDTIKQMRNVHLKRDPIDRAFFDEKKGDLSRKVDKLIFRRDKKKVAKKKKKRRRKKKKKKKKKKTVIANTSPAYVNPSSPRLRRTGTTAGKSSSATSDKKKGRASVAKKRPPEPFLKDSETVTIVQQTGKQRGVSA